MEKELVSFDQAVVLSELKYDGDYNYTYTIDKHLWYGDVKADGVSTLAAPLKQQVFRWFRKKYDAHMHPSRLMRNIYVVRYGDWDSEAFKTYEEAENACIDKLIELAKQEDNGK